MLDLLFYCLYVLEEVQRLFLFLFLKVSLNLFAHIVHLFLVLQKLLIYAFKVDLKAKLDLLLLRNDYRSRSFVTSRLSKFAKYIGRVVGICDGRHLRHFSRVLHMRKQKLNIWLVKRLASQLTLEVLLGIETIFFFGGPRQQFFGSMVKIRHIDELIFFFLGSGSWKVVAESAVVDAWGDWAKKRSLLWWVFFTVELSAHDIGFTGQFSTSFEFLHDIC